jgi:DNA-binding transcriptional LysR family regulator
MDTVKFKAFIECVNRGSVTAAAQELNYTPSAVSQLITSLEKELGVKVITVKNNAEDLINRILM